MNKEFVEIINRLRAILQDSWINELPDNEKIAINFNKSELKLILNCISKERPAPVRIDHRQSPYSRRTQARALGRY